MKNMTDQRIEKAIISAIKQNVTVLLQ